MKPDFALKLSHEAICLLWRAEHGWQLLDEVLMSDPALDAGLARLRDCAARTAGGPFHTKLVLPEGEVLFATLDAPGPTEDERAAQVRAGIGGLTSYDADDLAYDWQATPDGRAHVAIAARFILEEAEAFAHAHQFNPVSVVAPSPGPFAREPFFGATRIARNLLGADVQVAPESEPMRILPTVGDVPAEAPAPEAEAQPTAAPEADTPKAVRIAKAAPALDATLAQADAPIEPEIERVETARVETARVETAEPETGEPEAAKPEIASTDSAKGAVTESDRLKTDTAKSADGPTDPSVPAASTPPQSVADRPVAPSGIAAPSRATPVPEKLAAILKTPKGDVTLPARGATGVAMPAALAKATLAAKAGNGKLRAERAPAWAAPAPKAQSGLVKSLGTLVARPKAAPETDAAPGPAVSGPAVSGPAATEADAASTPAATEPTAQAQSGFLPEPDTPETERMKEVFDRTVPPIPAAAAAPEVEIRPVVFASRRSSGRPGTTDGSVDRQDAPPARVASIAEAIPGQSDAAPERDVPRDPPTSSGELAEEPAGQPAAMARQSASGADYYGTPALAGTDGRKGAGSSSQKNSRTASAAAGLTAAFGGLGATLRTLPASARALIRRDASKTPPDAAALAEVIKAPIRVAAPEPAQPPGTPARSALDTAAPRRASKHKPQPVADSAAVTEAEALTIFGARRQATPATAGRGTGLILTGALVLVLAAVAVWSVYFLRDDQAAINTAAAPPESTPQNTSPGITRPDVITPQVPDQTQPRAPDIGTFDPEQGLVDLLPAPDPGSAGPFNIDEPIAEAITQGGPPALLSPDAAAQLQASTPDVAPDAESIVTLPDAEGVVAAPDAIGAAPDAESADAALGDAVDAALAEALAPPVPDSTLLVEDAPPTTAPSGAPSGEALVDDTLIADVPAQTEPAAGVTAEAAPEPDLSPEALLAAYPETGIWPFAPDPADAPASRRIDDLFVAQPDAAADAPAIDALPEAGDAQRDAIPRAPTAPPAFADLAVLLPGGPAPAFPPGGASEPDVVVTAGQPPVVPPLRADTLPPVPVFGADVPDIPLGVRPLPRPENLVPGDQGALPQQQPDTAIAAQPVELEAPSGAVLDTQPAPDASQVAETSAAVAAAATVPQGTSDISANATGGIGVAALRPVPRPGTAPAVDATPEGDVAARSILPQPRPATLVAAAALRVPEPERDSFADATENAVARSILPNRRPAGFAQLAAQRQAAAAAVTTAAAAPAPTPAAAAAPARAAPSLPTRASVAEEATEARAINLRRVNLIGVFGTSSSRRALVRLSGGSVVSLRVGDRLEGSQVTAIGESELRYGNDVLRIGG